jgi:hypothetical protein
MHLSVIPRAQAPERVAPVLKGLVEEGHALLVAMTVANGLHRTKLEEGLTAGLVRWQPGVNVLFNLPVQVVFEFFLEAHVVVSRGG